MKEEEESPVKVAILLFEGVELSGVSGVAEVFSATENFEVFTVGLTEEPVQCQNYISILPAYTIRNCPPRDILVIPGGKTESLLENQQLLCWIRSCSIKVKYILSVCKGAALLAKAGLLNNREVTSFKTYQGLVESLAPSAIILPDAKLTDNGQVITTTGISAGTDGALHIISLLKGKEAARETAGELEYKNWRNGEE